MVRIVNIYEHILYSSKYTECGCIGPGITNSSCMQNGACFCKDNYNGKKCTSCKLGHYGPECKGKICYFSLWKSDF